MKHRARLTDAHRFTIAWILAMKFDEWMKRLDLVNGETSHSLRFAGEAWDAYKALTGRGIYHL